MSGLRILPISARDWLRLLVGWGLVGASLLAPFDSIECMLGYSCVGYMLAGFVGQTRSSSLPSSRGFAERVLLLCGRASCAGPVLALERA